MKLKQLKTTLKWLLNTGYSNHRFISLYKDLNGLYYQNPVKARLANGSITAISTMRGGVQLLVDGERYYLRQDHFNSEIYVQREIVETSEWENLKLWQTNATPALRALVSLLKHNPYVPSDDGVRYAGY